tara:strand:- start:714 stop:1475 length:762 start_codon:yes stop_codon:yes gene_type:complete
MNRDARRLQNIKEASVASGDTKGVASHAPSNQSMKEGEQVFAQEGNKPLALYKKNKGTLWKVGLSNDGNQYFDKNINIHKDINYNGYLRNIRYPAFKAYISTVGDAQSIATGTRVNVQFDSEEYDLGGNYDISAYKFTAPTAGIYHFNAKVLWDNNTSAGGDWDAGDRHDIYLIKNDSSTNPSANSREASELRVVSGDIDSTLMMNSISGDLKLSAGDFITVAIFQNTGDTQYTYDPNDGMWSSWSGHLITAI